MFKNLEDVLNAPVAEELIDPIKLQGEDVMVSELVSFVSMGIFNPMGPTLICISLLTKPEAPSAAILYTSLNPFSQSQLIFARCANEISSVCTILPQLYQVGGGLLLGGYPDFVYPATESEELLRTVTDLTRNLVSHVPAYDDLGTVTEKIKKHWKSPWDRVPPMSEVVAEVLAKKGDEPRILTPSKKQFNDWFSTVTDMEHLSAEIGAIIQGWRGSIMFQRIVDHMSIEEAVKELAYLGNPLFEELRKKKY